VGYTTGQEQRRGEHELRRKVAELERALGRKTYELEIAGKASAGWECACASPGPAVWSPWARLTTVARVLQVSRQALYWTPSPREAWLNECETLDDARRGIGGYVERYHHRPHSGLSYRTPLEVRQTWEDLQNIATSLNCQHLQGAGQPRCCIVPTEATTSAKRATRGGLTDGDDWTPTIPRRTPAGYQPEA
jgi:hypothetical protein